MVGVIVSDLSSHPGGQNRDLVAEFYQSKDAAATQKSGLFLSREARGLSRTVSTQHLKQGLEDG